METESDQLEAKFERGVLQTWTSSKEALGTLETHWGGWWPRGNSQAWSGLGRSSGSEAKAQKPTVPNRGLPGAGG